MLWEGLGGGVGIEGRGGQEQFLFTTGLLGLDARYCASSPAQEIGVNLWFV